ncbi:MAG: endonuclease/exonuclease/phosphatase family protein [Myxococcaceae bacterium]
MIRRLIAVLITLSALAGCEPTAQTFGQRVPVMVRSKQGASAPAERTPPRLKVMAWNVKFGAARIDFFFDFWGTRTWMTGEEVHANMAGIYKLINEVRPDVLLVEEIEVNSRRSAYFDMVGGILENTHLAYAAYVPTWNSRYIPSEGLGRMDMGNAIFSVFPIASAESLPLSDRTDLDAVHKEFYLHRAVGRAVLQLGSREVAAMVVHTEAYDTDGTASRQFLEIQELLKNEPLPFVIGGDFNALPPTSVRSVHFNDESDASLGTEYEQPPYKLDDMKPFFETLVPEISLQRYGTTEAEQRRYYTHSVIGPDKIGANSERGFWTRKLDYLFLKPPGSWLPGSTDVLQKVGDGVPPLESDPLLLSDHCPVVGTWEVAP